MVSLKNSDEKVKKIDITIKKLTNNIWLKYCEEKSNYEKECKQNNEEIDPEKFQNIEKFLGFVDGSSELKNHDFILCCDSLKVKDYKCFKKILQSAFFKMDNCRIIRESLVLNDAEHFKYILNYVNIINMNDVLTNCLLEGYNNIVNYILNNYKEFQDHERYLTDSVYYSLDLVKQYLSNPDRKLTIQSPFMKNIIYQVIHLKRMDDIKWLFNKGIPINNNDYLCILKLKNIELLQWLDNKGLDITNFKNLYNFAAQEKLIMTIKWLFNKGIHINSNTYLCILKLKNIELLQWLDNKGLDITNFKNLYNFAIQEKLIMTIKWLFNKGIPINNNIYLYISTLNNIGLLRWLDEKKLDITNFKNLYYPAIQKKLIETIKWLFSKGIPIDNDIYLNIMILENIELLQWLDDKGLDITNFKYLHYTAIQKHLFKTIKWLINKGIPVHEKISLFIKDLQHLIDNNISIDEKILQLGEEIKLINQRK